MLMKQGCRVVPYVGTWIEIRPSRTSGEMRSVVPYVGTWIEISSSWYVVLVSLCRSLRGNVDRNFLSMLEPEREPEVVPYVGTWIEIFDY